MGVLADMSYIQPTRHPQRLSPLSERASKGPAVQRDALARPRSIKPIAWTTFPSDQAIAMAPKQNRCDTNIS